MNKKEYIIAIKDLKEFSSLISEYREIIPVLTQEIAEKKANTTLGNKFNKIREEINKRIPIIKYYLREAGQSANFRYVSAPIAGGRVYDIDLLDNIFNLPSLSGVTYQNIIDIVNRCIGFYEYLVKSKKSIVELQEAPLLDIINLIEKNLRKSFKKSPNNETEVQDHVETIFNVAGIKFSRDKVSFKYSTRSYKPDFIIEDLETVVEVKFCNSKGDESKIITEINDDVVAYKTKYKILIFIMYDMGVIIDEDKFKEDITDNHNVYVNVIKH